MSSKGQLLFIIGLTCVAIGLGLDMKDETFVTLWPQNQVLRVGQEGRINLTVIKGDPNTEITIKSTDVEGLPIGVIYSGIEGSGHIRDDYRNNFQAITDTLHDIKIKSMSWGLAGRYGSVVYHTNQDGGLERMESGFNLTVVDPARCEVRNPEPIVEEDDIVNLDCLTRYTGPNTPEMKWMVNGVELNGVYVGDPVDPDSPTPAPDTPKMRLYRANFTAKPEHNGQSFKCHITFGNPEVKYSDNCESTFNVVFPETTFTFPIANITFDPDPTPGVGYFITGETLNCSALGNPKPRYQWHGFGPNGSTIQYGPELRMTDEMVGGLNNYTCDAYKYVHGWKQGIQRDVTFYVATDSVSEDIVSYELGIFKTGEMINCSSLGNPDLSYMWKGDGPNGEGHQEGPVLTMTDEMVGGLNTYRCYTTNDVRGFEYLIHQQVEFHVKSDPIPEPIISYDLGRFKTGESINCSVLGDQDLVYMWKGDGPNGEGYQIGPILLMTDKMVGGLNTYRCYTWKEADGPEYDIHQHVTFHVTPDFVFKMLKEQARRNNADVLTGNIDDHRDQSLSIVYQHLKKDGGHGGYEE